MSESADSLREWLSVARVEAEQGSPGSGHAHSGVEKFSRRYTALHTCAGKYFYVGQQILRFKIYSTQLHVKNTIEPILRCSRGEASCFI